LLARLLRVAADAKKMLFLYPPEGFGGCGITSDSVNVVILLRRIKIGNPDVLGRSSQGEAQSVSNFKEINHNNPLKLKDVLSPLKFETFSLGCI
jgi:hypothetical protein